MVIAIRSPVRFALWTAAARSGTALRMRSAIGVAGMAGTSAATIGRTSSGGTSQIAQAVRQGTRARSQVGMAASR